MCAIAGVLGPADGGAGIVVRRMLRATGHRGPDDSDCRVFQKAVLGSNRLSLVDLTAAGRQPLVSACRNVAVVCNGEIYNHKELRAQLKRPHAFTSRSDCELLLHLYEEEGIDFVHRLNGMYAMCLVDCDTRVAYLVRDRIGIKPLYLLQREQSLYFASELKAFTACAASLGGLALDVDFLPRYLGPQFVAEASRTPIAQVTKLPPGHYARIDLETGVVTTRRYWRLEVRPEDAGLSYEGALERCRTLLESSVDLQTPDEVRPGVLLSGGLDSSVVASLLARRRRDAVACHAVLPHALDETEFSDTVVRELGMAALDVRVDPPALVADPALLVALYDDLSTTDPGVLTTYLLCKKLRESADVKVVLVGEGADEVFGGYRWFGLGAEPLCRLPKGLLMHLYYAAFAEQINRRNRGFVRGIIGEVDADLDEDVFRAITRYEVEHSLPNHYLMKVDKASMYAGVEARVPYLDHRLVEMVFSLRASYKMAPFWSSGPREKRLLRDIARPLVPRAILGRKKRGFLFPVESIRGALSGPLRGYIEDPAVSGVHLSALERSALRALGRGQRWAHPWSLLAWKVLLFELWAERNNLAGVGSSADRQDAILRPALAPQAQA